MTNDIIKFYGLIMDSKQNGSMNEKEDGIDNNDSSSSSLEKQKSRILTLVSCCEVVLIESLGSHLLESFI